MITVSGVTSRTTVEPQLRLEYDDDAFAYMLVDSSGDITIVPSGGTFTLAGELVLYEPLGVGYGGTGLYAYAAGDIVYAGAVDTLAAIAIGSSGRVLTSSGTAPQWSANIAYAALPTTGGTWANGGALSITGGALTVASGFVGGVGTNATSDPLYIGLNSALGITLDVAAANPIINIRRAGGTQAARSNVADGNVFLQLLGYTFSGATGYWLNTEIRWTVEGAVVDNQRPGSRMGFFTNVANAGRAEALRITSVGDLAIKSGAKIWMDGTGATGNAYIYQSTANQIDVVAANLLSLSVLSAAVAVGYIPGGAGSGDGALNFWSQASGLARMVFNPGAASNRGFIDYDATNKLFIIRANEAETLRIASGVVTVTGTLSVTGTVTIPTALTGIVRADSGVLSIAAGVGSKSLFDHFADANNGTTVETDLYSDTIPAGRLAANGEKLEAVYAGIFTGDATSTQRARIYFGGTLIFDSGALAIGVTVPAWDCFVTIMRVSSSVVRCSVSYTEAFAGLSATAQYTEITGLTLANTQVLKITGTAAGATGASNQITAKKSHVLWLPAAA